MSLQFIIAITEHRNLGYILAPYLVEKKNQNTFFSVVKKVHTHNLEDGDYTYSPIEEKLVKLIEKYSNESLLGRFASRGSLSDFFKNIELDTFTKRVVPYIEKQILKCLELLKEAPIPLYRKESKYSNLYEEDLVGLCYRDTSAIFNFERLEHETRYYLTIRYHNKEIALKHRNVILLTNHPCRLLYQGKLYFFDNLSGNKLLPFFEKNYVSIPRSVEDKYYRTFVLSTIRHHQVQAKGFDIVEGNPDKKAILSLEEDQRGNARLMLIFRYNQRDFPYTDKEMQAVYLRKQNENYIFHKFGRDKSWEKNCLKLLRTLGLVKTSDGLHPEGISETSNSSYFYSLINWLNMHQQELEEAGIELEQHNLDRQYYTGGHMLDIEISDESDWFDIYAYVHFGDYRFPFVRLKKNILNGVREFQLPNGEIAILPEEWFARYRDIFTLSETEAEHLKLRKHHFPVLENNLKGINKKYLQKFKQLTTEQPETPEVPPKLNAMLRAYQEEGFGWMYHLHQHHFGGCLADDMGLGKTVQTLALLVKTQRKINGYPTLFDPVGEQNSAQNRQFARNHQPASLIVLPASLVHNWEDEILKFAPTLKYYKYIGARRRHKINMLEIIHQYDVILTTYGTVRNDREFLKQHQFYYLILDEGQYIKNSGSKTYRAINDQNASHRLVLTGTPIENSLSDLWSQINFLNRGLLGSLAWFKREFISPIERKNDAEAQKKLQHLIQPFILRRTKEQVARDLPPLSELVRYVDMAPAQKKAYEAEKSSIRNNILSNIEEIGLEKSAFVVLQGLIRLRQLANHPAMIEENRHMESGKFNDILRMLSILVAEKHKILIFSSFVRQLKLLAKEFEKNSWNYSLLTGQTRDRKTVIDNFQQNPDNSIFLISLKAGGVGLNLTSADYVFIIDPWWNPAAEMQAVNRAHRIGQDKNVFVYRFITEGTIEEKIQKLKEKKSSLAGKFINTNNPFQSVSKDELMHLFED
ncbi:DEAD/DEAH box helicase [Prolixibacter sp. SD074]|uniref:DEAD/DEAH box helicase n=1 Tax=Prolixibacter sp. SD074 TaxID=2652391 RepID=UPI00128588C5|nr:DEAD/DEAH box helicase [Prolixibacter sp. SD074]GET29549.1 hypothetical protein SD074_17510 [Prolixibacter sp. SD074]